MSVAWAGSVNVLCVDDDQATAAVTARRLEAEDDRFEATTVYDADSALTHIGRERVDCVVSDHEMPGRTGLDLLEAVRADHPDLPFVLYTAKGSEEIASEAISAGVTDYVRKRVGNDQYALLANRIDRVVENYRSSRELEWYRTVADAVDDMVYAIDDEGRVVFVANSAGLTGYEPGDLVGDHISKVMAEESRQKARERIEALRAAPDRESVTFERVLTTAEGDTVRCEDHMALLPADDGFRGTAGIIRGIGARKDRERDIERMESAFERLATEVRPTLADARRELADGRNADDAVDAVAAAEDRLVELLAAVDRDE